MEKYIEKTDKDPFDKREVEVYAPSDDLAHIYETRFMRGTLKEGTYLVRYPKYWNSNNPVNSVQVISKELLNKYYEPIDKPKD